MIHRLLIASLICTFSLFGDPPPPRHEKPMGLGNYGEEKIDSVQGEGLVKLNGTNVTDLHVSGSLLSRDAKVGSLIILGEANLRDTIISGEGDIVGFLQTHGSQFQKSLTVCSQKAIFTRTKIQSLTVRKEPSYKGKQVIELKQGSIVYGPIHFESGKGEVQIDASSRIEGKVTGGKVIRRSS